MGYSVIADVGNLMVRRLSEHMIPDVIQNEGSIGLCSPEDHGDFRLGLYLYDISECDEITTRGMMPSGVHQQKYPSSWLNLYYMITAYSNSDIKYRQEEEQKILGRAIQTLKDYSTIGDKELGSDITMSAKIEPLRMEQNDKLRLWNFPNIPYHLSLFYKVSPVEVVSAKVKDIVRVSSVDFTLEER